MVARKRILLALGMLLISSNAVAGTRVAYDTYAFGAAGTQRPVGNTASGTHVQWADPFLMSGGDGKLERVILRLRTEIFSIDPTEVEVRLREDDGGLPGTILESWTVADNIGADTDLSLESLALPLLLDGETYWVNLAALAPTGTAAWTNAAGTETMDFLVADGMGVDPAWAPPSANVPLGLLAVEVPEPAPALLGILAILAFRLMVHSCPRGPQQGPTGSPRSVWVRSA